MEKVHKIIEFNKKGVFESLHRHERRVEKKTKTDFEKKNFKLIRNYIFSKTIEHVRNHRIIKFVTTNIG